MSTLDHNEPDDQKILGSHGPRRSTPLRATSRPTSGSRASSSSSSRSLIFVAVCGVVTYGMGKLINARMNKEDGPNNKWTKTAEIRQLGNLPSSPEMQNKVAEITQELPNTSRANRRRQPGRCRSAPARRPAARQLHLGRSVAGQGKNSDRARHADHRAARFAGGAGATSRRRLLAGDSKPTVTVPLTSGFARTGIRTGSGGGSEGRGRQTATAVNRQRK